MYGIINRFTAHPGQRDALAAALTTDEGPMVGCVSFVLQNDLLDADVLWLTEVWETKDRWQASVDQPAIAGSFETMAALVKDWGSTVETEVVARLGGAA